MELNDINFMAPGPDRFRFYHRKNVSEDMIAEVMHFFRHAIDNNIPLPEFLSADYSFIRADLATIYGVDEMPRDSKLRNYTFTDGRRGGLLGMAAFHTATADSIGTSPIHRAVYVMENFLGIITTPPPPDVQFREPDVRQAKTIKEALQAHVADKNCSTCHQAILRRGNFQLLSSKPALMVTSDSVNGVSFRHIQKQVSDEGNDRSRKCAGWRRK
jgi:hypothetical protein